jgi:hypothetical protein
MSEASEQMIWLFDSMKQFLAGPEWALPVWEFIDENCIVFDSEDENKLAHTDIYQSFVEIVETLLTSHLEEMGASPDQFVELCRVYGTTDVGKETLEQVLAVDDYLSFKKMMVKRNKELEKETLTALQELQHKVEAGQVDDGEPAYTEGEEDPELAFEAELQARATHPGPRAPLARCRPRAGPRRRARRLTACA